MAGGHRFLPLFFLKLRSFAVRVASGDSLLTTHYEVINLHTELETIQLMKVGRELK